MFFYKKKKKTSTETTPDCRQIEPMAVEKQKELTAEKDKFNCSISLNNEEIKQLKIFSINRIKKLELVIYSPMRWVQVN